jgi:hypothetical protein
VVIDNGIGSVSPVGTRTVYPSATTVYILTASNEAGNNIATATIEVLPSRSIGNPVINYFSARYLGATSWELRWNVSYAISVRIDPEIGMVGDFGTVVVNAPGPKTYTIIATNDWGWSKYYVTIGYQ